MEQETFKDIVGYEGLYQISNYGNVYSFYSNKILKPAKDTKGYYFVNLVKDRKNKTKRIHRLIAIHFISNPNNKREVNHVDGNRGNNDLKNLEWVTPSENSLHALYILCKKIKPVIQMDLKGNVIKIYQSATIASKETNTDRGGIICVSQGKQNSSGGFKWVYAT